MISVFPTSTKLFFLSPFRTVLCAIHMQVTDRPSPDAPSLTQAIIVQMVYYQTVQNASLWGGSESRFNSFGALISRLLGPAIFTSPGYR